MPNDKLLVEHKEFIRLELIRLELIKRENTKFKQDMAFDDKLARPKDY